MLDAIKPLLDSGLINEDVSQELTEAWEKKLTEAREQVRAELREEFAQRYEHDKQVMVEALDRMVTEGLSTEIQSLAEERQQLAQDRVQFQAHMKESAGKFDSFMVSKLAEEIGELRKDRRTHIEAIQKLEKFVVRALAEEIQEFAQDKRELVETRVRLVTEARSKLESLKTRFVKESASKLTQAVASHLKQEMTQLKEDIQAARENLFGRRIFEAYAAEFSNTHLNENRAIRQLRSLLDEKNQKLSEAANIVEKAKMMVESKDREIRMIQESNQRTQIMEELLNPLREEKRSVMKDLLESVQTSRLKNAYEKYLPAVLAETAPKADRKVIGESVSVVTGDKTVPAAPTEDRSNVIEIKRLAGL
jgi:DNA repair exonuclease SbcCD ATPase subunit